MRAWFYFALCRKLIIGLVCFRVGAVEVTLANSCVVDGEPEIQLGKVAD